MKCAWCELELESMDRQTIRLSNSQPPWSFRSAGRSVIGALGNAFSASIRAAMSDEPVITLWFHRECWHDFLEALHVRSEIA